MQKLLMTGIPFFITDKKKLDGEIGKFFHHKCRITNIEKPKKGEWCVTVAREKLIGQSKEVKILLHVS